MSNIEEIPERRELAESRPPQPPRFQFGISTLLWIMTATAVICSLLFPMPEIIAMPVMLFVTVVVLPAVWTTVIVYGRGYQRTFAIGAMFPVGIPLIVLVFSRGISGLSLMGGGGGDIEFRLILVFFWVSCLVVGAICVGVRRFLERRSSLSSLLNPYDDSTNRNNGA